MHSREHGAHTRNEQCVTSASGFDMTFQFTLGSGARREPFRTPQAICTPSCPSFHANHAPGTGSY